MLFFASKQEKLKRQLKKQQKTLNLFKSIKQNRRFFVKLAIVAGAFVLCFAILVILRATSVAVSEFMTRTVSNFLVSIAGAATSIIPIISVFEFLTMLAVALLLMGIVWTIIDLKKRRGTMVLKRVMMFVLIVLVGMNYFALTVSFSYNRADISNGIALSDTVPRDDDVLRIANHFMDDFNYLSETVAYSSDNLWRCDDGYLVINYHLSSLANMLRACFRRALDGNSYFFMYTPRPKVFLNSWWHSAMGVAGMAFLPTGEGMVNYMPPTIGNIMVMAHELAHMRGVMRENDADLVAFYVLVTSPVPLFRYIGYIHTMFHLANAVHLGNNLDMDILLEFESRWPRYAALDSRQTWRWWREFRDDSGLVQFLNRVGEFFNDLYLRLSGVEDGTGSYGHFPDDAYDTGERHPETDRPIFNPVYNNVQRMFFAIYKNRV